MKRIRVLAAALFLLGLSACSDDESTDPAPTTIHVPGDAATLQEAIDLAQPGMTVLVGVGNYEIDASITIPADKDGLVIRGDVPTRRGGTARPRIDCLLDAGSDVFVVQGQDVHISNLEIVGFYRMGINVESLGARIENCKIVGAGQNSINCPDAFADPLITRNLLIDATRFGVSCEVGSQAVIDHNTIVNAGDCGIYTFAASPTISGNIVAGSHNLGIACFDSPLPSITCNALFENVNGHYSASCTPGAGNLLDEDPLFCEMDEYTLMAASPCSPANATGECPGGMGASDVVCPDPGLWLQRAIDEARPGTTILVDAGTDPITASVTIPDGKDGLVIRGAVPAPRGGTTRARVEFVLDREYDDAFIVQAQDVHIENLEIVGSYRMGVTVQSLGARIESCKIVGAYSYSVYCPDALADPVITRNLLIDPGVFGVSCNSFSRPVIDRNTIVNAGDCGIFTSASSSTITRNIITGSHNWGIACFFEPLPSVSCNALFESTNGHYNDPVCGPGTGDVLDEDPRFCETVEYSLMFDSPCTPENAGACGGMGASEVVCTR